MQQYRYLFGVSAGLVSSLAFLKEQKKDSHAMGKFMVPFFKTGVAMNPKYEKRYKDGEDAYAIGTDQRMIMVCDGVGGWAEVGEDSGKFSKFLVNKVRQMYDSDPNKSLNNLLVDAVKANPNRGSTTAVMAKIETTEKQNKEQVLMKTCNLGDSAYLILRPSADGRELSHIFRSKEQTYSFDFPYQCG